MVQISATVTGLPQLGRNASKLKKSFSRSTLRTALRNAAKPVVREAKDLVVVDTGEVRDHIGFSAKVLRDGRGFVDIGVRNPVFHGIFLELGTSTQAARPFLRPAIAKKDADGSIRNAFVGALNRTITRTLGRL